MLPFFLHGAYFLEMLAVFQLNGILLCVVVTFLSSLMWEEEAIDYMRWGFTFTHTHTRGEIGHRVCGSNGRLQWKDLCVAVAAILGPFSSGAFVSHPRRASSQRDKEAGKRRESEGGQFFFQPFYSTLLSFFDFKGNWRVLEQPSWFTFRQFWKRLVFFVTHTLWALKWWCRLSCNSHEPLLKHDLTELQDTVGFSVWECLYHTSSF